MCFHTRFRYICVSILGLGICVSISLLGYAPDLDLDVTWTCWLAR